MKAARTQLGILLVWVSSMTAQTLVPATVEQLRVVDAGSDVRIELRLSATVKPSLIVATKPDRLVLELPNTISEGKQKRVAVHVPGIRGVRIGLHQGEPPVTRLVVDLDESVPYQLLTEGTRLTLVLSTQSAARSRHTPPARAVSGGLAGMLRSGSKAVAPSSPFPESADASTPAAPSPSNSAATGPAAQANTGGTPSSSVTDAAPSARQVHTAATGSSFPPAATATSSVTSASSGAQHADATLQASADTGLEGKAPAASASSRSATAAKDAVAAEPVAKASSNSPTSDQTLLTLQAADPNLRTIFRVKYVADGVVYLDGGSSSGLGENMKLEIRDTNLPVQQGTVVDPGDAQVVAELEVTAAAETSSVADIHSPKRPVKVGDLAYLSAGDAQALIQQRTLSATRKYPAVVTFTDNDAMDEEAHDEVPRPPMPSVNRARGMFGIDYMGTVSQGSTAMTSNNIGGVMRLDITRLAGTYWNVRGYWRGNLTTESASSQPTLQDLINRTYHLNITYENPNSRLVAGFGRLYLPWAPSLDTIDGGYFGARLSKGGTIGMFAGSTPDPTSYSYNPDGKIAGVFINFEGGSYDATHYSSTSGAGMNAMKWQINRPFVFFENSISYKHYLSIYDSMQMDSPRGTPAAAAPGPGLGRNFLTIRIQPHPRFEFDVNHTYLRDIPTYDPTLLSLGLLDKFLFQGFSVGGRVEVVRQIWLYTDIGQSNRTGDAKNSLNQAFGITFNRIPRLDLHVDAHYSKFSSSFGSGSYRAFSVSRSVTDRLHLDILFGDQSFSSSLTSDNSSKFINANVETSFGSHYFLQGGFTVNRGSMNYNQWMYTLGYRFDTRMKQK